MSNFDKIIDRHNTNALKYVRLPEMCGTDQLTALWIADMDFETPDFIVDAMRSRLDHKIFGYTGEPKEYRPTLCRWVEEHGDWHIRPEWITFIPGIVKGIGMAINVFVKPDEKVIIQPPVYHPFRLTPLANKREVVFNPLIMREDGQFDMDFENLEKVADEKCRLLILCNPHNPGGRIWPRETLRRLADFCAERGILVISDEIHCDMPLWGKRHIPFASVSETAAQNSITFQAPSKTFNIAGIVSSFAIVPNDEIREKFFSWLTANELNEADIFAHIAACAAYTPQGEEWRQEMLRYVEGNIEFAEQFCAENIPGVKALRPEASFLIWLDCRGLGLEQPELVRLFVEKAKLALNDGTMFGQEGKGFMRLNIAAPRSVIKQALQQLKAAVDQL